jgi:hypothetical protein
MANIAQVRGMGVVGLNQWCFVSLLAGNIFCEGNV